MRALHFQRDARPRPYSRLHLAISALICFAALSPEARLVVDSLEIRAETRVRYSEFGGPVINTSSDDRQFSFPPFLGFQDSMGGFADGVADAFSGRPGLILGQPLYAAALQQSIANAVAVQSVYTGGVDVDLRATTQWALTLSNAGSALIAVDFSFFIAGGGLEAWCTSCFGSGLSLSATAALRRGPAALPPGLAAPLWRSVTQLDAPYPNNATLRIAFAAGSVDMLGIGFPDARIFDFPDPTDEYSRAEMDAFHGSATLLTLNPGEQEAIVYELEATVMSSASAFGTAWLVDPFSLGTTPTGLAGSGFAINGVSVESMMTGVSGVPQPPTWMWMWMLAGLLALSTTVRRQFLQRVAAVVGLDRRDTHMRNPSAGLNDASAQRSGHVAAIHGHHVTCGLA